MHQLATLHGGTPGVPPQTSASTTPGSPETVSGDTVSPVLAAAPAAAAPAAAAPSRAWKQETERQLWACTAAFAAASALALAGTVYALAVHDTFLFFPAPLRRWALPLVALWATYFLCGAVVFAAVLRARGSISLVPLTATPADMFRQIGSAAFDLVLILPLALWLVECAFGPDALMRTSPAPAELAWLAVSVPASVLLGYVWRAVAHRVLHTPALYARFHKKHHCIVGRMTPWSAFLDTTLEFVVMEVVGTFCLPLALAPCPAWVVAVVWTWMAVSGVLDHANIYVAGSAWFDSSYHTDHHRLSNYNYAELEVLDRLAGTLVDEKKSIRPPRTPAA